MKMLPPGSLTMKMCSWKTLLAGQWKVEVGLGKNSLFDLI